MRKSFRITWKLSFICLTTLVMGMAGYVPPSGDDGNPGIPTSRVWRAAEKVNRMDFIPGGKSLFVGSIYLNPGDTVLPDNPVTISAFGTDRAVIQSGSRKGIIADNGSGRMVKNLHFIGPGWTGLAPRENRNVTIGVCKADNNPNPITLWLTASGGSIFDTPGRETSQWILEKLRLVFSGAYQTLLNLALYVIAGVLASEILKSMSWGRLLIRISSTAPVRATLFAVLIGIVSPLCTYGTIPVILALFRMGLPVHPLVTFLVASSLMNPQLFLITWGGIGPEMAWLRLASTVIFSLLFGLGMLRIDQGWIVNTNLKVESEPGQSRKTVFSWKSFLKGALQSLQFVGFYIVLGVVLGAVVEVFVPSTWLLTIFQSSQWMGVLFGALLGVPLYACGGGTIPLIHAMMEKGMSAGAALAFFTVGPATRITPLIALSTIIRPRFIGIYILLLFIFAVLVGFLVTSGLA